MNYYVRQREAEPYPRPVVNRPRLALALAWAAFAEIVVAAAVLLSLRVF
jgi:hypothetical protein